MENAVIHNVWQAITPELEAEIIQFWLDQKALPSEEEAKKRVPQVAFVARNPANDIVAISTVYPQMSPQLANYLFYARVFVADAARRSHTGQDLLLTAVEFFESRFKEGHNPKIIGLFLEVENAALKQARNQAVWPTTGFVYLGQNARGDHLRVRYFEGARIN